MVVGLGREGCEVVRGLAGGGGARNIGGVFLYSIFVGVVVRMSAAVHAGTIH